MEAIEYLKAKGRMTKMCEIDCHECPLHIDNNGACVSCPELQVMYPELAIAIVEEWNENNPQEE